MNRDPIGEKGGRNLYRFIENNPYSNVDILGYKKWQQREMDPSGGKTAGKEVIADIDVDITQSGECKLEEDECKKCEDLCTGTLSFSLTFKWTGLHTDPMNGDGSAGPENGFEDDEGNRTGIIHEQPEGDTSYGAAGSTMTTSVGLGDIECTGGNIPINKTISLGGSVSFTVKGKVEVACCGSVSEDLNLEGRDDYVQPDPVEAN